MSKVLGISGSLYKTSNTDTLIKTIMEATGAEYELIKLSNVNVRPCIGCKKCVQTNECVRDDDFKWISKKLLDADAIIVGSPVIVASVSAITKAFIERLDSFFHAEPQLLHGKLAAGVVIGWTSVERTNEWLTKIALEGVGGMNVVGSVTAYGHHGSLVCGKGETCPKSAWNLGKKVELMMGQDNEIKKMCEGIEKMCEGRVETLSDNDPLTNPSYKILDSSYVSVKDQPEAMQKAEEIGKIIQAKLQNNVV